MMDVKSNIPDFQTPFLTSDGRVNEVWWRFLLQMFNRTGGFAGLDGALLQQLVADAEGLLASTNPQPADTPPNFGLEALLRVPLAFQPKSLGPESGLTPHHGKQDDPEQHALATPSFAGFMSAADKTRIDQLEATDTPTFAGLDLTDGQITFPAVAVPSAGATVLDDYREVSFTPALAFGGATTGITYGNQLGRAVKIGGLVWTIAAITLTSKGTATGAATITGYPFSALFTQTPAYMAAFSSMAALTSPPFGTLTTTTLSLFDSGATGQAALDDTNFTNTSTFRVVCIHSAT